MAIPAISQVTKQDDEKEAKQGRARRARQLPGLARKISELALELEQTARLESERDRKDEQRIRGILNAATGGAIERLVKSMQLTETDRDFLREHGWRV
jgi:hypothetical protein